MGSVFFAASCLGLGVSMFIGEDKRTADGMQDLMVGSAAYE